MFKILPVISSIIFLTACGVSHTTEHHTQSETRGESPSLPPIKPRPPELSIEYFAKIREFGAADTAALYGVRPSVGQFEVKSVYGPTFLKNIRVGTLDASTAERLFASSSKPLSAAERNSLVNKYSGSTVVYFEGYQGQLCRRDEVLFEIRLVGKLNDEDFEATFQMQALPNSQGDCDIRRLGVMYGYKR